jgi:hypothetical protein
LPEDRVGEIGAAKPAIPRRAGSTAADHVEVPQHVDLCGVYLPGGS